MSIISAYSHGIQEPSGSRKLRGVHGVVSTKKSPTAAVLLTGDKLVNFTAKDVHKLYPYFTMEQIGQAMRDLCRQSGKLKRVSRGVYRKVGVV